MGGKFTILLIALLISIGIQSCDNPYAFTPGSQNVVTGINITYESSPEVYSVWGTTNYPEAIPIAPERIDCHGQEICREVPDFLGIGDAYPNPTTNGSNVPFYIPVNSNVKIWIESANWGNFNIDPQTYNQTTNQFTSKVLFENEAAEPGYYVTNSGTSNVCFGGDTPPGFYRIFFNVGDYLSWRDIYIYGPKGTNPPGLEILNLEGFECDPDYFSEDPND